MEVETDSELQFCPLCKIAMTGRKITVHVSSIQAAIQQEGNIRCLLKKADFFYTPLLEVLEANDIEEFLALSDDYVLICGHNEQTKQGEILWLCPKNKTTLLAFLEMITRSSNPNRIITWYKLPTVCLLSK